MKWSLFTIGIGYGLKMGDMESMGYGEQGYEMMRGEMRIRYSQ